MSVLLFFSALIVVLLGLYLLASEVRVQIRNWRTMHRNPRPGYVFPVDRQETRKRLP